MTLSEFYSSLGESLDEVLERLRMESRVAKYLGLFLNDPSFSELKEAFANNDAKTAFRSAHTLKGVAANLGLNKLSASSSETHRRLTPGSVYGKLPDAPGKSRSRLQRRRGRDKAIKLIIS